MTQQSRLQSTAPQGSQRSMPSTLQQGTTGFSPSPIKSSALTQPTQQSLRSDIFSTPGETWNGFATEPPKSPDITELTQRMIDDLTISPNAQKQRIEAEQRTRQDSATFNARLRELKARQSQKQRANTSAAASGTSTLPATTRK